MRVIRDDFPVNFRVLYDEIGGDNLTKVIKHFSGCIVYFPIEKSLYKEARNRQIVSDFDSGIEVYDICRKYDLSMSYVRTIISNTRRKMRSINRI